jgi:NADH-quinone oxidoreductase subunit N
MLIFMTLYMVDVTGFFACLIALKRDGRKMETFQDMAGLFRERPGIALCMTAFSLSALGLPPFSGFWGKFFVFKAANDAGLYWLSALGLLSSVVAAFYYLRLIKTMWFDAPPAGRTDRSPIEASGTAYVAALFATGVVFVLGLIEPLAHTAATAFLGLG